MAFYESGVMSQFNFGFVQEEGIIANAANKGVGADFATNVVRWNKLIK